MVTAERSGRPEKELRPPTSDQGLLEVFRRRYLLRLLVRREIQARYSGSFLGMLWSYLNPLSQFFIYWFVMGIVIQRDIEEIAIHVFSAMIIVYLFTETFNAGTRSIVRNSKLVQRMPMPREMFPVASMLVSLVHVGPQFVILIIACVISGWRPDAAGIGATALALGISVVLGTACALVFSVANVFFRDFQSFVAILTNLVRFGVPMIYPFRLAEDRFANIGVSIDVYLANPICDAVLLMQRAFWIGAVDAGEGLSREDRQAEYLMIELPEHLFARGFIALGGAAVLLVVAQVIFNRFDNRIPERLST